MLSAQEITQALVERRMDSLTVDTLREHKQYYDEHLRDVRTVYDIYDGNFDVLWPDGVSTRTLPKVANFVALAADQRSAQVGSSVPMITFPAPRPGDRFKAEAEKRERIVRGYWHCNHVPALIQQAAFDAMMSGLTSMLVIPDTTKPKSERFPKYKVLEPLRSFPDPIFGKGPYFSSFIYAYEEHVRVIERTYGVKLDSWRKANRLTTEKIDVAEFYDDTHVIIVAYAKNSQQQNTSEILHAYEHGLGMCPAVGIGRAAATGKYRSEFVNGLGALNTLNRLTTMMLDDAAQKVYAPTISWDVENPEDYGPGAHLIAQSERARFEYVQPANQVFSNLQIVRDLTGAVRAAMILPPSSTGDPNESIISAAGVSATNQPVMADVRDLQMNVMAPLLEAANTVALKVDEVWCDAEKAIGAYEGKSLETYTPSKDIAGNYRNVVSYGQTAGLDSINTNVMALQQLGANAISIDTFMEQSIFVDDPTREKKRIALQAVDQALQAGLIAQAGQGALDAATLAEIRRQLESDEVTLHDAIAAAAPLAPAPLAPPASGSQGGASPQAPGLAGAGEGQSLPQNLPPLAELLG